MTESRSDPAPEKCLAVVGAGQMGSGIAQVCLRAGFRVYLVEGVPSVRDKAKLTIAQGLERRQKNKKIANATEFLAHLEMVETITAVPPSVPIWLEAVTEQEETKFALFAALDAHANPKAILASNTSSLSLTRLASQTQRPSQVAGLHFFNPVALMPLIELVAAEQSSAKTLATLEALGASLEKTVVRVPDIPGFVANRLIMPLLNEAILLYAEGAVDPRAIDEVMRLGFFHPMGPLEMADLIGLDTLLSILEVLQEAYGERFLASPILKRKVAAGHLGKKTGRGFYRYDKS